MTKNHVISMVILFSFLYSSESLASSLRCRNKIVSIGDHKWEIQSLCGPPAFIDQHQEERISKRYIKIKKDDGNKSTGNNRKEGDGPPRDFGRNLERDYGFVDERKLLINSEEWTYNFGPDRFVRTLIFENSRLVAIDTGGYGYDETKTGQSSAEVGDSKAVVFMKYGQPTYTDQYQEEEIHAVNNREDENYFYVEECTKYINVDEWTYDFGPRRLTQRLLFKNNKLVYIDY